MGKLEVDEMIIRIRKFRYFLLAFFMVLFLGLQVYILVLTS